MSEKFDDIDYWKAIILFGLNQATYKIALGKTLLDLADLNLDTVDWTVLSKVYFDNYVKRLNKNSVPQQSNPSRRTVIERIHIQFQNGLITYDEAINAVEVEGFNDVIPRFQTIWGSKDLIGSKFYHFDHGKKLYLHDSVFKINEDNREELLGELEARWSLLEGAFAIGHENWELANDVRITYLNKGYKRRNLTDNIPFLKGYQGNVCFYCGEKIMEGEIHVDHVLPRQVLQHDEIWNLVLSHGLCNLNKEDCAVGIHYIEKLINRNENIMGSNHPWKYKISNDLGRTKAKRAERTKYHYENVKIALNNRFWENSPQYNREADPFFKKLITHLNNK